MKKPVLNFVINSIMALCMSAIIGIGFLMEYTLISGQKRWLKYGENVDLYWLGMDRHQWGNLHLILGFILLGLLALHLFLHWNVITNVYKKIIQQPLLNKLIAIGFLIICATLILVPIFIKPDVKTIKKGYGRQATLVINQLLPKTNFTKNFYVK